MSPVLEFAFVRATLRPPSPATYADYLAVERKSEHRHEFLEGVIVAKAAGSDEHNAIAGRLAMLLGLRLRDACRYYTPDQRFWIAAHARARYTDASIICGKPSHPAHDPQASANPVLVLEVLSPSSQGDDDGEKRIDFQTLASLRAYLLVSQDQRLVRVYTRDESGDWPSDPEIYDGAQAFSLPALSGPISLEEIYAGILDADGRSLLR
jgi:Uma2 family endonuclease